MCLIRPEQASTARRSWRSRERDLAIFFWCVRPAEPGRNKESRTTRPTQRRVHGNQLDVDLEADQLVGPVVALAERNVIDLAPAPCLAATLYKQTIRGIAAEGGTEAL